ncbi:uncharacterized protein LOC128558429 [Mercenaria mercenaria]|uniref:uncharacterized protein LOC128558429 n=1 Tax=Mercenaria mercenaria TaxID=6596 RepID=UPI00234F4359|nr:uncharacterized protein LOC128558429 [Mercenaria mercenaria]
MLKVLIVLAAVALSNGQLQPGKKLPPFASSMYSGNVKERIKIPPTPMPGFNVLRWVGKWFFQFHKPSYSWAVSEEFTDYEKVFELQGNDLINHERMRNYGVCNSVTSVWHIKGPGYFEGIDTVGDNWSGKIIVVDTDYTGFYITWGCTKWSVFSDRCEDPGVYVLTRQLTPDPTVLRRIELALQNTFGISVNQLIRIPHGKRC